MIRFKLRIFALLLVWTANALANPDFAFLHENSSTTGKVRHSVRDQACLTAQDAENVAQTWIELMTNFTESLTNQTLVSNMTQDSSSTIYLVDSSCSSGVVPLDAQLFSSRASFIGGQSAQPNIPMEALNVWHGCDSVTLRWKSPQTPQDVIGVTVMEVIPAPASSTLGWYITRIFDEFNAGAFLVNLGIYTPVCGLPGTNAIVQ